MPRRGTNEFHFTKWVSQNAGLVAQLAAGIDRPDGNV